MAKWGPPPLATTVASDGDVAAGYYYEFFTNDGTYTSNKNVYKDAGETTTWSNPLGPLTSAGLPDGADMYFDGIYDVKVYDGDPNNGGNLVRSIRNYGEIRSAVATDLENLIQNASFETDDDSDNDPDEWTVTANAERSLNTPAHGAAHLTITDDDGDETAASALFEIGDLQDLELSFDVAVSNAAITPKAHFEWYDKLQTQTTSPSQNTVWEPTTGTLSTDYQRVLGINIAPPTNARYAKLVFTGNDNLTTRSMDIDNVVVRAKNRNDSAPRRPSGLQLSRDSGDTDHDINVTAGAVQDENYEYDIVLKTEITKQMDSGWAIGDDAGGMESGGSLPADGMIYIWAIKKTSTGEVDILGSNSATSPTMPSGWDAKQYIGGWRCDSSNNLEDGFNVGSYWWWNNRLLEEQQTSISSSTSNTTVTAAAPPYCLLKVYVDFDGGGSNLLETEFQIGPTSSAKTGKGGIELGSANINEFNSWWDVQLDENSQFTYNIEDPQTGTISTFEIQVMGWIDLKREYGI